MSLLDLVLELVLFLSDPGAAWQCHNAGIDEGGESVISSSQAHADRQPRRFGALLLGLAMASVVAGAGAATPSTFAPVIGSALLCRSHLENNYFYSYLTQAFGPAYRHSGGAHWFRIDAQLWGQQVKEVMVSDDSSALVFVAAVIDTKPDQLAKAVRAASGVAYRVADRSRYPLRTSISGSTIAYASDKSKIYCVRFKPQPPGP